MPQEQGILYTTLESKGCRERFGEGGICEILHRFQDGIDVAFPIRSVTVST